MTDRTKEKILHFGPTHTRMQFPLTDAEYFGPGGLLDRLPESIRLVAYQHVTEVIFDEKAYQGGNGGYVDCFGSRSEALKKAILIAHLKGNE